MQQNLVRFEGWTISTEAKYHEINKEVVVMLSWHNLIAVAEMQQSVKEYILNLIYNRIQSQIVLAKHEKEPYKEALYFFIDSLIPEIPFCANIITNFIENTNDLYFVLLTLSEKENLDAHHVELIHERWENEKTIVEIKANQNYLWMDNVKKLARSFGIKTEK